MTPQLGCLPSRRDLRTLRLELYLPREMPKLPERVTWHAVKPSSDWGMDGNDKYGNCVICTAAHMLDAARANESGKMRRLSDAQVINLSRTMGAMNGYTILERLKRWRKVGMWHSKILGFADVPLMRHDLLKYVIWAFGSADIAVWMPAAWQRYPDFWGCADSGVAMGPWRPGSWGGHSVCILGYEPHPKYRTIYKVCTWGRIVDMTYDAVDAYVGEVWASILPAWYRHDKVTPSGFDYEGLKSDLGLLK